MDKRNEITELTLDKMDKVFGGVQTIRYDAAKFRAASAVYTWADSI